MIEGIPTLHCLPERAARCPVVFYCPGFGGGKEHGLALAYRLAQRGLACLCFDPLYHGDRYDERLERAAEPGKGGVYPIESGLDTFLRPHRHRLKSQWQHFPAHKALLRRS